MVYSSIAKVPKHLRDVNEKSYEPQIIAIGPYHRVPGIKPHLEMMEEQKIRCLKSLVQRTGKRKVEKYVRAMREWEGKARACYADVVKLNKNDFAEMMLLDACFIVELFRHESPPSTLTQGEDYKPALPHWIKKKLIRDLLLVENQLPFFILRDFFAMTEIPGQTNDFLHSTFDFFNCQLPVVSKRVPESFNIELRHLLSFVHSHLVYPVIRNSPICQTPLIHENKSEFIRCATELQETGVEFMTVELDTLFRIRFRNGKMKIPRLTIEEDTEAFFRNLIVYEQYYPQRTDLIIDYIKFMDCLINSAKDVELLCHRKIIHNRLGDDEVVANMFNRLCDSVTLSSCDYYSDIYSNVNRHCSKRLNRWMANLRHNYFNTPWALISFIAASLLLLFTLIQTLFPVIVYFI